MAKKQKIGVVASAKANKTIVVTTNTKYFHKKYAKAFIKTKRFMAHDEKNSCQLGDFVLIEESPPLSKSKKWILKELLV